jgi:DNA modification methylase
MDTTGMTEKVAIISSPGEGKGLDELVPPDVLDAAHCDIQKAIPALAKDLSMVQSIERAIKRVPTKHQLILGDSRGMESIADESVHLVVTSPPYWTLKKYPDRNGQLGQIDDYEEFLDNLDQVWRHVLRVLVPGGRMVVVVGDVCLPRRQFGRHVVYPLHASIQEHCRKIGFDNLAPIIWYKISNAQFESKRCTNFLG